MGPEKMRGGVWASGPELDLDSPHGPGLQLSSESGVSGVPGEVQSPSPREVPPLPLGEDSSSEPCVCPTSPRPEPPRPQSPAQAPPLPSPQRPKVFLLTPVPPGSENHRPGLQEARGLLSAPPTERTEGPGTPRTPLCLALPGLPATPESRPEEEEEDSEDSDESDEELRCYSTQEPSEESEEEAPPVPVVVAERQSARSLRSLLKMPSLLSEAFREDLERKKKAVSFFDDVTVYLFDQVGGARGSARVGVAGRTESCRSEQCWRSESRASLTLQESPTRELGEPFPGAKESPPADLAGSPSSPSSPSRPRRPEGSGDGAEEGELGAGLARGGASGAGL